jgi:hypothetical protein
VSYRDDRQALALQLAALEQENERLKSELDDAEGRYRRERDAGHEQRRQGARDICALCGGSMLPVAVFAGHDMRAPLPLSMSTIRFGDPAGGFTHAAPVRAYACSSCGHLQQFIDMDEVSEAPDAELALHAALKKLPAPPESED